MDMRIPPLRINIMFESAIMKSTVLVRRLAVGICPCTPAGQIRSPGLTGQSPSFSPMSTVFAFYQEGTGSVRFVSIRICLKSIRFGSARFGTTHFPVPPTSACVFRTRSGSVRFGSVRFRVWFRPVLVRPVRFGFFFLPA